MIYMLLQVAMNMKLMLRNTKTEFISMMVMVIFQKY